MQFTADAALLFAADGEQLVGEAALVGLGVQQGGGFEKAEDEARSFEAGICGAAQVDGEATRRAFEFDGELKAFGAARTERAEEREKKAGSRKAEENGKFLAEETGAGVKSQRFIGTPDAQKIKSGIELEDGLLEVANDGGEGLE